MRRQTHKSESFGAAPDINTVKTRVQLWISRTDSCFEGFSFVSVEKKPPKQSQQRLGEKMLLVRRVRGVGVSPCGWNVSPGWTCHCCFCRPSVEIPFQASHGEDFTVKTSSFWESFWAFFVRRQWRYKTKKISVLKRDVKAPLGVNGKLYDSHIN